MAPHPELVIIYNADSSVRGKLAYAYRKFTSSSKENPACAACDITHGGLSLNEVDGWKTARKDIEAHGFKVVQWHRDQVEENVKTWAKSNNYRYPLVLSRKDGTMELVADTPDLVSCAGDPKRLVELLKEKKLIEGGDKAQASL
ncbi:Hypothetical predicted protein [Lecanosticta acicola]|uniref:Uncharacterized protein n=1 Tax=Lecanosticta acicola TaxID=111012 RepID=A0AAI9E806_9PEZI|nr:Hypothetical predicted protein [Lecanosticta acicola]